MKIFIKQNSDFPSIEFPLKEISVKYNIESLHWENAVAVFSLYNKENGTYLIANERAEIVPKKILFSIHEDYTYNLRYKLTKEHTKDTGVYVAEFKVVFLNHECGTLTLPEFEKFIVIINRSITETTITTLPKKYAKWYYGTVDNIVRPLTITLLDGTLVDTINSSNDLEINYNTITNKFIWFAIPELTVPKITWEYNNDIGDIGGPVVQNGNLFPSPVDITVFGSNYRLYLSNYPINVDIINILN